MRDVTVIADDLTGAADCGAAFASAGLSTFVAFEASADSPTAQVLSIDTETRLLPAQAAAVRTSEAVRRACAAGTRVLYKKIDSTLRGNVGAELAATLASAAAGSGPAPLLLACSAFPSAARIVRAGQVLVHGVPLGETEVWRQSGTQGPCALADMLRAAGLVVASASTTALRSDPRSFGTLAESGVQAIVCDAEDDVDLRALADAGTRLQRPVIWAGSAGLARQLPAALDLRPQAGDRPRSGAAGPLLLLVGSRSQVSREQARRVAGEARVESLEISARLLLAGTRATAWAQTVARLTRALQAGNDLVLTIACSEPEAETDLEVAAGLGRLCATLPRFVGLVATGADTARAALMALGASGLHLVGEVEPGVPLGLTEEPQPRRVITKAGAFGTPHTLQRCRAALHSS